MKFFPPDKDINIDWEGHYLTAAAGTILTCTDPFPLFPCAYPYPPKNLLQDYFSKNPEFKKDHFVAFYDEMYKLLSERPSSVEGLYQMTSAFRCMLEFLGDQLDSKNVLNYNQIMQSIHWYCQLYMERFVPSLQLDLPEERAHCLTAAGDFHHFISDHLKNPPESADPLVVRFHANHHSKMAEELHKKAFVEAIGLSESHPIFLDAQLPYFKYKILRGELLNNVDELLDILKKAKKNMDGLPKELKNKAEEAFDALNILANEWDHKGRTTPVISRFITRLPALLHRILLTCLINSRTFPCNPPM